MRVSFSDTEKRILELWYISKVYGGHWGDNFFAIPEEEILINKIKNNDEVEIDSIYKRILKYWSEESNDTPEEEELRKKIENL